MIILYNGIYNTRVYTGRGHGCRGVLINYYTRRRHNNNIMYNIRVWCAYGNA